MGVFIFSQKLSVDIRVTLTLMLELDNSLTEREKAINMNRRRITILIITVVCVCFICGYLVYSNYYRIDLSQYGYGGIMAYAESPDGTQTITASILRIKESSDISYIVGRLSPIGEHLNGTATKVIFYQRVNTESLDTVEEYGIIHEQVDLKWIDNRTAEINGIVVDTSKGYDYRRN